MPLKNELAGVLGRVYFIRGESFCYIEYYENI